ncbi:coagulogen-like isoform X2 [Tachypleus tridentatus]|uniref:coagulogen-like isoform X2 n=1 Tax=Tachypleus tridentatus TaxID=6853 RepID=UPI003FD22345
MLKEIVSILFPLLVIVLVTKAQNEQPVCLCEENEDTLKRQHSISDRVHHEVESKVKIALEGKNSGGRERRHFPHHPFLGCGQNSCINNADKDRCSSSLGPPCNMNTTTCKPNVGYNLKGELQLIIQFPEFNFEQCIWKHTCEMFSNVSPKSRCIQFLFLDPTFPTQMSVFNFYVRLDLISSVRAC